MAEILPMVFRKETKQVSGKCVIEEKQLQVQGPDLVQCQKIFDGGWEK